MRAEAWHRRATEGGRLGAFVNAAPQILLWGTIIVGNVVVLVMYPDDLKERLPENWHEYGCFVFLVLLWAAMERIDAWLVQTRRRWRKGDKDSHPFDDNEPTVPLE